MASSRPDPEWAKRLFGPSERKTILPLSTKVPKVIDEGRRARGITHLSDRLFLHLTSLHEAWYCRPDLRIGSRSLALAHPAINYLSAMD